MQARKALAGFKRKRKEFQNITFFSLEDIWHYIPKWDRKLCDKCFKYARTGYFVGKHLRRDMKYLEIVNENTINANIHPHCRCILTRVTDFYEYIWATALIWG